MVNVYTGSWGDVIASHIHPWSTTSCRHGRNRVADMLPIWGRPGRLTVRAWIPLSGSAIPFLCWRIVPFGHQGRWARSKDLLLLRVSFHYRIPPLAIAVGAAAAALLDVLGNQSGSSPSGWAPARWRGNQERRDARAAHSRPSARSEACRGHVGCGRVRRRAPSAGGRRWRLFRTPRSRRRCSWRPCCWALRGILQSIVFELPRAPCGPSFLPVEITTTTRPFHTPPSQLRHHAGNCLSVSGDRATRQRRRRALRRQCHHA